MNNTELTETVENLLESLQGFLRINKALADRVARLEENAKNEQNDEPERCEGQLFIPCQPSVKPHYG